ncbi:MAG: helix-turn-helix transcriptional regulator [Rhizomicrobium sp.]|jgi:transcriptional regulator with XRE-family HTH domain
MLRVVDQKQATEIDFCVGKRMSTRRREIDMSQQALGKELGVSFQQIQKYEKGASRVSAGRLFQIAKALGVTIGYFYSDAIARAPGMAEDEGASPAPSLSLQVRELLAIFARIREKPMRRQLIEIAKSLAEKSEDKN